MDLLTQAASLIKSHEGFSGAVYLDTEHKMTIGYGRNLEDVGISEAEATVLLCNDVTELTEKLDHTLRFFEQFSDVRKCVLIDMAYNLGWKGFCGFKRMLACLEKNDFTGASAEMLDSRWAKQVGDRAAELARMMRDDKR